MNLHDALRENTGSGFGMINVTDVQSNGAMMVHSGGLNKPKEKENVRKIIHASSSLILPISLISASSSSFASSPLEPEAAAASWVAYR